MEWGEMIAACYDEVDAALADALLESVGGDVLACAASLEAFSPTLVLFKEQGIGALYVPAGTRLLVVDAEKRPLRCLTTSKNGVVAVFEEAVIVESPTRRFARTLDAALEAYVHVGDSTRLGVETTEAVLRCVEMRFLTWATVFAPLLGGKDGSTPAVDEIVESLRSDGAKLVESSRMGGCSGGALGRFSASCAQLCGVTKAVGGLPEFERAVDAFEAATLRSASPAQLARLAQCCGDLAAAIGPYVSYTAGSTAIGHAETSKRLERAAPALLSLSFNGNDDEISALTECFSALRPTAIESALAMVFEESPESKSKFLLARSMPPLRRSVIQSGGAALESVVTELIESAIGDYAIVSDPIRLLVAEKQSNEDADIIQSLLHAGLAYSYSPAGSCVAQLANRRCVLRLGDQSTAWPSPSCRLRRALRRRRSDCSRQLRRCPHVSLRFDTLDLDAAVELLRSCKDSCWVGANCLKAWRELQSRGLFGVFELWDNDIIIALDFVHIDGPHAYLATRYSTRTASLSSPGFVLALAMAHNLRSRGFHVVDLGGVDLTPQMEYKLGLTDPLDRVLHLHCFRHNSENYHSKTASSSELGRLLKQPSLPPRGVLHDPLLPPNLLDLQSHPDPSSDKVEIFGEKVLERADAFGEKVDAFGEKVLERADAFGETAEDLTFLFMVGAVGGSAYFLTSGVTSKHERAAGEHVQTETTQLNILEDRRMAIISTLEKNDQRQGSAEQLKMNAKDIAEVRERLGERRVDLKNTEVNGSYIRVGGSVGAPVVVALLWLHRRRLKAASKSK